VREQKDASRTKTETLTRYLLWTEPLAHRTTPYLDGDAEASNYREITKSYRQLLAGRAMPGV
jgi:hypothetical protein